MEAAKLVYVCILSLVVGTALNFLGYEMKGWKDTLIYICVFSIVYLIIDTVFDWIALRKKRRK